MPHVEASVTLGHRFLEYHCSFAVTVIPFTLLVLSRCMPPAPALSLFVYLRIPSYDIITIYVCIYIPQSISNHTRLCMSVLLDRFNLRFQIFLNPLLSLSRCCGPDSYRRSVLLSHRCHAERKRKEKNNVSWPEIICYHSIPGDNSTGYHNKVRASLFCCFFYSPPTYSAPEKPSLLCRTAELLCQ